MKRKVVFGLAGAMLLLTGLGMVMILRQFDCSPEQSKPWGEWVAADSAECR